jgi:hypothetical protein
MHASQVDLDTGACKGERVPVAVEAGMATGGA